MWVESSNIYVKHLESNHQLYKLTSHPSLISMVAQVHPVVLLLPGVNDRKVNDLHPPGMHLQGKLQGQVFQTEMSTFSLNFCCRLTIFVAVCAYILCKMGSKFH